MRIRDNLFEVDTCLAIKYMTRVTPLDKRIGFKRNLDNVCLCCCLLQRDHEEFLIKFIQMLGRSDFPFVVGGDLNIISRTKDRNKAKKIHKWFIFHLCYLALGSKRT